MFDREYEWSELARFAAEPGRGALLGVVSGRRRQGKTFLLDALCEATGGFFFAATEATESESLRQLGHALAEHVRAPAPLHLDSWPQAFDILLDLGRHKPTPVVIDEFPYLVSASPVLPSVLQAALRPRRRERLESHSRIILCGSALSFMGKLLSGSAPLRGRAGLELTVSTLDYRRAAEFWGITHPRLAAAVHAVVGGTPAYRREYVRDDAPESLRDFDAWIARTVLSPASPLFREARYLLNEEPDLRDTATYHSALAAIADGNRTRGAIANYLGRKATDVSHHLTVLEDAGLLAREPDAFRANRPVYRVTEPLVNFYHAIVRPEWSRLERPGHSVEVWRNARHRFESAVLGPHFEDICRTWAERFSAPDTFGAPMVRAARGLVNAPREGRSYEIDVAVLGADEGGARRLLSIGEAKWGRVMDVSDLERLRHVRRLLASREDIDLRETRLACYSGGGFTSQLRAVAAREGVLLVDLDRLYLGG
ncbi:MAG: AAA family ATPase [Streptomycetales bacterium]